MGARAVLAASGGGHLAQLVRLESRLPWPLDEVTWFTFDTPQSRSVLADRHVVHADYAAPRDAAAVLRNTRLAGRLLRSGTFDVVVSTGASVALSILPLAAMRGLGAHYVESAARAEGPSVTGRILRYAPRVRTYCQYPEWAGGNWVFAGSVFDGFASEVRGSRSVSRVTVTVGSQAGYGFRSLISRLVDILPDGVEVIWQTGSTDVAGLGVEPRPSIPAAELVAHMVDSDVVVAHAGVGSALAALEAGRCPVLVPRRKSRAEHVDDHQVQVAEHLEQRGLALCREPDRLCWADLEAAAALRVSEVPGAPPLRLAGRAGGPEA
ncbi:MAG: UDP-N-acetylglucosamine--N-acetylmuramyl-(pentapeptide) pyrophosphoryl-undecaprenol N-acetylglucosamine transferase [Acidimicrobiales bacterium]|nr:UDP-N-acetylglucosamine--N-acetylmuramyl-(pentapeptide) pyrophosphoryl-undecaprenol N-acetylglucosamine transferase [Acidimicrobiales bacterium]